MELEKLNDMQRYLLEEEMENFSKSRIHRREFLHRAGLIVGSAVAGSLLATMGCQNEAPAGGADAGADLASAGMVGVAEDDPAILVSTVEIPHANGTFKLKGYVAAPATRPLDAAGLLVIHENRAMTPHIKDMVRRWGKAGYVALGVDLLSRQGGTEAFPDEGTRPGALSMLTPEQLLLDLSAGLDFLKNRPDVKDDRLGATGFCFGGGYTWRLATVRADLRAGVAFYGPNPPLADVKNIKAAMLGLYGALDTRITSQVPLLETELKNAGIRHEIKIYDGADHAFNNDTGTRYNAAAAMDAWQRSQAWFAQYL